MATLNKRIMLAREKAEKQARICDLKMQIETEKRQLISIELEELEYELSTHTNLI